MNNLKNQQASNLKPGIYKIVSIDYPMAIADYKASITETLAESVQIELAILFHPVSKGPKDREPKSLLGKLIHIAESGTRKLTRNFVLQDVDYAVWNVLNKETHRVLVDGESKRANPVYLIALNGEDKWKAFNFLKATGYGLALDEEQSEDPELYNDMGEVEELEQNNDEGDNENKSNN